MQHGLIIPLTDQPYPVLETYHGMMVLERLTLAKALPMAIPQKDQGQTNGRASQNLLPQRPLGQQVTSRHQPRRRASRKRRLEQKCSASQDHLPRRRLVLPLEVPAARVPLFQPSCLSFCHTVIFLLGPTPFWLVGTAPRPVHSAWVTEIARGRWTHHRFPGDHRAVDPSHPDL